METNTIARTLHDVGLALWTGGSTMGAVGVNGAATAAEPRERLRVAGEGWSRWMPAHLGAITAYGVGSLGLTWGNRERIRHQRGVASLAAAKTALTAAAPGRRARCRSRARPSPRRRRRPRSPRPSNASRSSSGSSQR